MRSTVERSAYMNGNCACSLERAQRTKNDFPQEEVVYYGRSERPAYVCIAALLFLFGTAVSFPRNVLHPAYGKEAAK